MQYNKNTKIVEQVAKVSSDGQQITENIYEVIKKVHIFLKHKF
jgi:type III secretion system FlhB-like substrate exporter